MCLYFSDAVKLVSKFNFQNLNVHKLLHQQKFNKATYLRRNMKTLFQKILHKLKNISNISIISS